MTEKRQAGSAAATALVVANMIGTGVFVSLSFQLFDFQAATPILLLWIVGGIGALCGALSYADLAKAMPRSGGEYHFLGKLYHPSLGFMAGLLSAVVGFSAPTAVIALALGLYFHGCYPGIPVEATAVTVILIGAASHAMSAAVSGRIQVAATSLKVVLIVAFLIAAVILPGHGDVRWAPQAVDFKEMFHTSFGTDLIYVFYAYTGWNAAVYGLEEWSQPERTVKRALVIGTLFVMVVIVLNAAFLHAATMASLKESPAIAHAAAGALFGDAAARWTSALLSIGLFSTVSAMLWAGPRVLGTIGQDLKALRWFAPRKGVPLNALLFQTVLALAFVFYGKLDKLVEYTTSALILCSALAAGGLFILRGRGQKFNLLAPTIYVALAGFVIVQSLIVERMRMSTLLGLITALVCALLWFPLNRKSR